jgi:peptidoglycan/xylan/chitin deacetylase (PgdA/CDA1 family)
MYHRVLTDKELEENYIQPGMYVHSGVFEMQMLFLKKQFQILSFEELLDLWQQKKWDNAKTYCVITFDDGWRDNYLYAYPILKKYNIPATIFLTTNLIGTNQWFWPDLLGNLLQYFYCNDVSEKKKNAITLIWKGYSWTHNINNKSIGDRIDTIIAHCKELSDEQVNDIIKKMTTILGLQSCPERVILTWEEVRDMSNDGISFGSHSCTHKILTNVSPGVAQREISDSFVQLREHGINDDLIFCYPNGNFNQDIARRVENAGYKAAVSAHFGLEDGSPHSQYGLRRVGIHNDIGSSIPLFVYRMQGFKSMI